MLVYHLLIIQRSFHPSSCNIAVTGYWHVSTRDLFFQIHIMVIGEVSQHIADLILLSHTHQRIASQCHGQLHKALITTGSNSCSFLLAHADHEGHPRMKQRLEQIPEYFVIGRCLHNAQYRGEVQKWRLRK